MTVRANHDGTAGGRTRRITAIALLAAVPFVFAGCHDEERLRQRLEGPPARLPVEPDEPKTPPAPALLDTVRDWRQPDRYTAAATADWPIVTASAPDPYELSFRVPFEWTTEGGGRARNGRDTITAKAKLTQLSDSDISLATYAAQLAEGAPIFQYATDDGHVVYLTRREVALAPSERDAVREVFHTAVVSIDGRIAKLDVRYDAHLDWRFDELASAITGTLQVRRKDS